MAGLPKFSSSQREGTLLHGVDELLDAGLAVGGLVLVDDALGSSPVELLAGGVCGSLGGIDVASLDGGVNLLDVGLQLGADSPVTHTGLLGGDDALLLRLDVCHGADPFKNLVPRGLLRTR